MPCQELISYFSKVDEPTAIVFFGDHQPNLPEDFYNTLLESQRGDLSDAELRQKKMVTPFFIWATTTSRSDKYADQRELSVRVCAERARLLDLGL